MSKWDKLITRICNLSKDLRFPEMMRCIQNNGRIEMETRQICLITSLNFPN